MADKTIMLACSAGMSTSLLVSKMQNAAKEKGKDYKIFATAASGIQDEIDKEHPDVLMLGPQVQYMDSVENILVDCDNDTLLIKARPAGPVCHTGADTCWGEENKPNPLAFLSELSDFIEQRHREMPEGSYTTSLFNDGLNRMAQKVGEEALELVIEATNGTNERLIYEGSDMLYHLIVLLTSKGLRIEQMAAELMERHNPGWKKH